MKNLPTWNVTMTSTRSYHIPVQAADYHEALAQARSLMENNEITTSAEEVTFVRAQLVHPGE